MDRTVSTATAYLRPSAREKLAAEGLKFPHAAVCYTVSETSQPIPVEVLRTLTGGDLPSLGGADFEPVVYR